MRRRVAVFLMILVSIALFILYATGNRDQLEPLSWIAGVISVFLAIVLAMPPRRSAVERISTPAQLDQAERALRSAMAAYVSDELARLGLDDVFIPLRWRENDDTHLVIDQRGALVTPASTPTRLIMAGEQGRGKTAACLVICRALVNDPEEAVPVLIPATSWRVEYTRFEHWASDWITSTVRVLANSSAYGDRVAEGLVTEGRVRCVIDGLDELPAIGQQEVLEVLARTGTRTSFILTSRPGPLRKLQARIARIRQVRNVDLLPSQPREALDYLGTFDSRWSDVDPATLQRLLSSPLTVYLMRHVYFDLNETGAADESTRRQLWRRLVSARLNDVAEQEARLTVRQRLILHRKPIRAWKPDQAQRWLAYLARDLAEPTGELRWWTFRKRVPGSEYALIALVTVYALLSEAVEMLVVDRSSGRLFTALFTLIGLVVMVKVTGRLRRVEGPMVDVSRGASLTIGIGVGALVGTSYGWVAGLSALVVTFGLTTVAGAALVAWSMRRQRSYTSPVAALRTARRVALISSIPTYVVIITAMYIIGNNAPYSASVAACVFAGHLLLSSVWGGYASTSLTCASNRHLPFRLTRFLEDMSRVGLLQRVGTHYTFRHKRLRDVLAADRDIAHSVTQRG